MIAKHTFRLTFILCLCTALFLPADRVRAAGISPAAGAEKIRKALFNAQLALSSSPQAATLQLDTARETYEREFSDPIRAAEPAVDERIRSGFELAAQAAAQKNQPAFASARAQVWTAILSGSYAVVEQGLSRGDGQMAKTWLPVREFRTTTRFSRPNADATLAISGFLKGSTTQADALLSLRAELFDTYQARLSESLRDLADADANRFPTRRAELAALAEGYFLILAPAYAQQRGEAALETALAAFAELHATALTDRGISSWIAQVEDVLHNFRAAPLSPNEQSRRAGQLLRFLSLVSVEYGRGVHGNTVTRDFEIQEAITFHNGASAAFADLENLLDERDPQKTIQARGLLDALDKQLHSAGLQTEVASADAIQAQVTSLSDLLKTVMPAEWLQASTQGDFDVISSLLDQMEAAVSSGDYPAAESSRLEAYAVLETGPEARLMASAPQLKIELEDLFWNGQGETKGLAFLIKNQAGLTEIRASRAALGETLGEAQVVLGANTAPISVALNAGTIVFREGLEAVIILASLMGSLKRASERKYRLPVWLGSALAFAATILTWLLAHDVIQSLARYGEKLEAVVSLIAIGVLLVIMNWFFHKLYWTDWIASFHARKKRILSGEAGLWLGLVTLGFTSIYREGFETVLFLQALVLEGGKEIVLSGVAVSLLAVALVGVATFRLQVNLPYKKMLILTGVLIGGVLLQMVGNTTHVVQVIGWLPIHTIPGLSLPYWVGMWFGFYATWEGISLQALAAAFVIGSYYLAEWMKAGRFQRAARQPND